MTTEFYDLDLILIQKLLLSGKVGVESLFHSMRKEYNVTLNDGKKNSNLINVGLISTDKFPASDPDGQTSTQMIRKNLFLTNGTYFTAHNLQLEWIITKIFYFPNENDNSQPIIKLRRVPDTASYSDTTYFESNDLIGSVLFPGKSISLDLSVEFPHTYVGAINKFIVIALESSINRAPAIRINTSAFMGFKVLGHITNVEAKILKSLSLDAKPFYPKSQLLCFDHPCIVVPLESASTPPTFASITRVTEGSFTVPADLVAHYKQAYLSKNYEAPIKFSPLFRGLFIDTASQDRDSHNNVLMASKYCTKLGILMWLEELHLSLDIAEYDLYCQKITFYTKPGLANLFVKFRVKGSAENRPQIFVGTKVRFRPALPPQMATRESVLAFMPYVFELVGEVISFKLRNEEVEIEVPIPPTVNIQNLRQCYMEEMKVTNNLLDALAEMYFHVRFTFDRNGFSFIHHAINNIVSNNELINALFNINSSTNILSDLKHSNPSAIARRQEVDAVLKEYSVFNNASRFNDEQKAAITDICNIVHRGKLSEHGSGQMNPYIIYGPPGTGKTSTIIESVLALRNCFKGIKILLAAPSDAAADVLATRLIPHCNQSQLFRLYYWQRPRTSVPTTLLPYTNSYSRLKDIRGYSKEDVANSYLFEMPPLNSLNSYEIIVSTCGLTGALAQLSNTDFKLQFDVVMVDEAANALEAEVLVPISLCKGNGCVVLAGDPMQLAASVRSPLTSQFQLFSSIQERLLRGSIYRNVNISMNTKNLSLPIRAAAADAHENKSKSGECNNGVFLTKNYRSNSAIIGLSSKIFYNSALCSMGDPTVINSLVDCIVLPNKNFPCMFVGVEGLHEHDMDSPSFYNISELLKIRELITAIVYGSTQVQAKEVGVICAFRSQVLRMRVLLRETGLSDVNVGSIEDYQGQENKVIIISTVLSSRVKSFEDHAGNHALIGDFRRFNVAITRAIALCIVVGNPYHLYEDKRCWYQFLKYCHENDSIVNCPSGLFQAPVTSDEINKPSSTIDISSILDKLNLYGIEDSETDADSSKHLKFMNVDLQWRVML